MAIMCCTINSFSSVIVANTFCTLIARKVACYKSSHVLLCSDGAQCFILHECEYFSGIESINLMDPIFPAVQGNSEFAIYEMMKRGGEKKNNKNEIVFYSGISMQNCTNMEIAAAKVYYKFRFNLPIAKTCDA